MTAQGRSYSFQQYAALDRVNFSRLKWMDYSPAHYLANPPQETKSLSDGRLIHTCLLEPQVFERTTAVWEGGPTKDGKHSMSTSTTAYKEFKAECEKTGVQVISPGLRGVCRRITRGIMEHDVASHYFEGGNAEISIEWTHPLGVECKSRIDYLGQDRIVDLKTSADIHPRKFNRSVLNYKYHAQAAFYRDAVHALTGDKLPFFIVAVEKCAPYDVAVYELDDAVLDLGRKLYMSWLERLVECKAKGYYPGIFEEPTKVELPNWAYEEFEDDTLYIDGVAV